MEQPRKLKRECPKKEQAKQPPGPPPKFVIGVRVRGSLKSEPCNPHTLILRVGMQVMVDTPDGPKMGQVISNKIINIRKDPGFAPPGILRIADEKDLAKEKNQKERESNASLLCW